MKRFIRNSLLLILPFSLAMMSASAVKAEENRAAEVRPEAAEIIASGSCGQNADFTLDQNGLLKITGSGKVDEQGWWDYNDEIKKVTVSGPSVLGTYLFRGCINLKEAVLGDSVREVGESCFRQDTGNLNESLESVQFGKGIRRIGGGAFSGNNNLKKVVISDLAAWCETDIGYAEETFQSEAVSSPLEYGAELILNGKTVTEVRVPDSVERIGQQAFSHYTYLEKVVIPASVKRIGCMAFAYTPRLSSVKFEGSAPEPEFSFGNGFSYASGIFYGYYLNQMAYYLSEMVSEINIEHPTGDPTYTNRIRYLYSSNYMCSDSEGEDPNEDWPDIFAYKKDELKTYCSDRVKWPEPDADLRAHGACGENMTWALDRKGVLTISGTGVMEHDQYVYQWTDYRTEITKVIIEEGVTSIDPSAFTRCNKMRSIAIPESMKEIKANAFGSSLSSLKYVCYAGSEQEWAKIAIGNTNEALRQATNYYNGEVPEDLDGEVKVTSIEMNMQYEEMPTSSEEEASTLQLRVSLRPKDADPRGVIWESTNPSVASVDQNGLVTAHTYGSVMITARHVTGGGIAYCDLQTRYYDVAGSPDKGDPDYQYFFNPVYWAADNNITKGYGNVYFGPDENCTREQMITFLYRTAGSPKVSGSVSFSDVQKGSYYYNAVLWASQKGITNGYSSGPYKGKFGVGLNVTREDTMTFIYRMAGKPKYSTSKTFKDIAKGRYYYDAVRWAAQNGITNGYSDGTFGVGKDVLRKDIVTFLYRYAE